MHQISLDELSVFNGDHSSGIPGFFSSGREGCVGIAYLDDSAVSYSDLIGITAKVFNGVTEPVESFFDIGAPVLLIESVLEFLPLKRVP